MTTARCQGCGARLDTSSGNALCPACMLRDVLSTMGGDEVGATFPIGPVLPHTFGNYELLEEIGRGGMGVVYAARQTALNRTVAVKLLLSGAYASETALQRFRTEAAAAAGLQHPNIVEIHDYGEVEGQPYYAMDLVTGRNLAEVCDGRPLRAPRAANLLRELADAVHYAHGKGILHRDLKPSNVLLDERDRPRITDFGLARRMDADGGVTLSGQIVGSPSYVSPEQAAGRSAAVAVASDIYGLGALFYHLLTGRAPFNAASPTDTLRLVLETDPPPPRLLNPTLPRDLETICLTCLAKEPARRYATAAEVRADIERFLQNRPIHARPPSVFYRARKFVRRYRTGVVAVAAVIVALAAGLTAALISNRRTVVQQQAAEAARVRSQEMVNFIMQKSLPQMQTLGRRQAMIESAEMAVRYFDQLPAALHDRDTIRAHATALDLLVQAYGNTWWRSTNRNPTAGRAAVGRAAALWRQLAESDPTDADAMASALFDEYLSVLEDPGRPPTRLEAAEDDLVSRFRVLEGRFPRSRAVELGLERLLHMRAYNNGGRRDPLEALASGREACERIELLRTREPDDVSLLWEHAWACTALASAHRFNGDGAAALRCQEEGFAIAEELLGTDPGNVQWLEVTANMAWYLMWAEPADNRRAERVQVARRYLATLITLDPEDAEWRHMDVMALNAEGVTWVLDRRLDEAMRSGEQSLERWRSLPSQAYNLDPLFGIGNTLAGYGEQAAAVGNRALAVKTLERLRAELQSWANAADSTYERSRRRFYYLYWQAVVVDSMEDWAELERLSVEMLAEADTRALDAPETPLLPPAYRSGAKTMLGRALLHQGRAAEVVAVLDEAVARFRDAQAMEPFYEFPLSRQWEAAENLARALDQTGDRQRIVESLEWAYEKRDAGVRNGGLLLSRVQLAPCAWQLAQALDADDPGEAARRREVLMRAAEVLDDPSVAPRLTPEERDLRAQIGDALKSLTQETPNAVSSAKAGT